MADNKFLKVMQDAATDRGLILEVDENYTGDSPSWASLQTLGNDATLVEVTIITFDGGGIGYRADVYEEDGGTWEPVDLATGTDTASLFRLLGTWLG